MTDKVPSDDMRAADHDRAAVVGELERAHAQGRLSHAEHDDRTRRAWAAGTYGDLAPLTADLPVDGSSARGTAKPDTEPAFPTRAPVPDRATAAEPEDDDHLPLWRTPIAAGLSITLLNVVVWLVLAVNRGFDDVYPWWIWIALVWGGAIVPAEIIKRRRSSGEQSPIPRVRRDGEARDQWT